MISGLANTDLPAHHHGDHYLTNYCFEELYTEKEMMMIFLFYFSFKKLCEDAFLKMRDCGPLFLNLFTMMLSCGIPELRTRADISYIRSAISRYIRTHKALILAL